MARTTYGALKLIRNCRLPWSALGRRRTGDGAPVGARPGHQTSASNRPHYRWCSHVQVTAYRRAPCALLSTLRPADEVGAHQPFTGPLLSNSARIILHRLRSRANKRRSPNSTGRDVSLRSVVVHRSERRSAEVHRHNSVLWRQRSSQNIRCVGLHFSECIADALLSLQLVTSEVASASPVSLSMPPLICR